MTENLIIFNARLVTPTGFTARRGKEMGKLLVLDDATIEVTDGLITYVGPNRGATVTTSTTGTITPAAAVCCPVS